MTEQAQENITILKGHVSPETAYIVNDYPYGFNLRCKIRYWIEYKPNKGFRFVSQTSNPKRGNIWNKAKALTYNRFGGCMYLTHNGHVHYTGLSEYCDGSEALAWQEKYGDGVPEQGAQDSRKWVAAKVAYDVKRDAEAAAKDCHRVDLSLAVGMKEAVKALIETK